MSSTVSDAPGLSASLAGTQDGAAQWMLRGSPVAAPRMAAIPSIPATLATSCGSAITAPVPWGTTARANSGTHNIELSMWMWASMNEGARMQPDRSIRS